MYLRTALLAFAVAVQFMLELTAGRVFVAPSLIPAVLVYLSENFEGNWSIDGAFWSGLCLDLLLHQPAGSSSLAFLAGMYAAELFGRVSAGEGKAYLLGMISTAVLVSDVVFIAVATRPFGTGLSPLLLKALPRVGITAAAAAIIISAGEGLSELRSKRVRG